MNFGYSDFNDFSFIVKDEKTFAESIMEINEGIKNNKTLYENIYNINSNKDMQLSLRELIFEEPTESFNKNFIAFK